LWEARWNVQEGESGTHGKAERGKWEVAEKVTYFYGGNLGARSEPDKINLILA